jgi:DNA-binding transcriptional ArsR family regulator
MTQESIFEIQADLCKAMSSVIRIEIINSLREGPMFVREIARITGNQLTTISRHIGILRSTGIVSSTRQGQDVLCRISNSKIVGICDLMRELLIEMSSHRSNLAAAIKDDQKR